MHLNIIFLINAFASIFLMGLVWLIQLVHYPSFRFVEESEFGSFHSFHSKRISIIVVPMMIIELITSGVLWFSYPVFHLHSIGFYLVILIWVSTALLSVPNHAKLNDGKDNDVITTLVNTNWVRTVLWSIKAFIAVYLLF